VPGTKKKALRKPVETVEKIENRLLASIKIVDLRKTNGDLRGLVPAEIKNARHFVAEAEKYLEHDGRTSSLSKSALFCYWLHLDSLYFSASLKLESEAERAKMTVPQVVAQFSNVFEMYQALDAQAERLFSLINQLLRTPSSPAFSQALKYTLHPVLLTYLISYCQTPARTGRIKMIENNAQSKEIEDHLNETIKRQAQLTELFQQIRPTLAVQERHLYPPRVSPDYMVCNNLAAQLEETEQANAAYITAARNCFTSSGRSAIDLASPIKQLVAIAKMPGLSHLTNNLEHSLATVFSTVACSSSDGAQTQRLYLSEELDERIISAQYKKIATGIIKGYLPLISTKEVDDWVSTPERLVILNSALESYISEQFPNLEEQTALLEAGTGTFTAIKDALDTHRKIANIRLHFFSVVQARHPEHPCVYSLLKYEWEQRTICMTRLFNLKHSDVPNTELEWLDKLQDFYLTSFEISADAIYKLLLKIKFKQSVPGFDEDTYRFVRSSAYHFRHNALLFLNHLGSHLLLQNQPDKYQWLLRLGDGFSRLDFTDLSMALPDELKTGLERLLHMFKCTRQLMQAPPGDALVLAQMLSASRGRFHASLRCADKAPLSDTPSADLYGEALERQQFSPWRARLRAGDRLCELIPELQANLLRQLPVYFGADPEHNLARAQNLQALLELFASRLNLRDPAEELLCIILKRYSAKVSNEVPHWRAQVNEIQQWRIQSLRELLVKDEAAGVPFSEAQSVIRAQLYCQDDVFVNALDQALSKPDYYTLGALVQATAHNPLAGPFHRKMAFQLFRLISTSAGARSSAELDVWAQCRSAFLNTLEQVSYIGSTTGFYLDVLNIELYTASQYCAQGDFSASDACYQQACALYAEMADKLGDDLRLSAQQNMNSIKRELDDPDALAKLLAWSLHPQEIFLSDNPDLLPPDSGTIGLMSRFQNAWQYLASAADKKVADPTMHEINRAWKKYFGMPSHNHAQGKLRAQWAAHYQHCQRQIPVVPAASSTAKSQPVAKEKKPKIDRKQMEAERKMAAIERHNQKREAKKARQAERRRLAAVVPEQAIEAPVVQEEPASAPLPLQETPIQAAQPKAAAPAPVCSSREGISDKPSPLPLTRPWSEVVKKPSFLGREAFPPLPVVPVVIKESEAAASSGPSVEPEPTLRFALPPDFRHMPHIQQMLDTLEGAGYLAFLSGWGVQYLLRGQKPSDAFVITNCPAKIMATLLPTMIQYDAYTDKCRVFPHPDRLPTTVKCVEAASASDLACAGHDVTINRFFVNAQGKLSAPVPEADEDLANQVLRTIAPLEDCLEQDISILWRMIRYSSELGWSLDEDTQSLLTQCAPQLCNMPIHQFIRQFKRCFATNEHLAWKNFLAFQHLALLPWLVAKNPTGFNDECFQFCQDTLKILIKDPQSEFFLVDMLVVFALMNQGSSLSDYQQQVDEWMQSFENQPHNPKVMDSLRANLPARLAHYYHASHKPALNVEAEPFVPPVPFAPYAGPSYAFFVPASVPVPVPVFYPPVGGYGYYNP